MTPDRGAAVTLSVASREARRAAGPVAWAVLEELAIGSRRDAGQVVVTTSIRHLARELGLSKDTVARALGRLRELGHVEADGQRKDGGRFGGSVYRLQPPDGVAVSEDPDAPSAIPPPPVSAGGGRGERASQGRARRPRPIEQPTLFDPSPDERSATRSTTPSNDATTSLAPTAISPDQPDALAPEVQRDPSAEFLPC